MSARRVLREACAVIQRAHVAAPVNYTPRFFAVDTHGQVVRPLDPAAVAWTSVGALCKVAPARSVDDVTVWADHTEEAWDAFLLLDKAARQQGHGGTVAADRAGMAAAVQMFWRAGQLAEPDRPGRRPGGRATGSGSQPRGSAA